MKIDDVRIKQEISLTPPNDVINELPVPDSARHLIVKTRDELHRILRGEEDKFVVIIGPCSIHDPIAAQEYAKRLLEESKKYADELLIIMRVYFEKPRTSVGWKGLINDPDLDNTYQINKGIRVARKLLIDINSLGIPAGTEFLDLISPQYLAELISWGAIGARTTESQTHRELVSGLSSPTGFKNGTDGNVRIAIDAMRAAKAPHHFLSVDKSGHSCIFSTTGNDDCHVILRGGYQPNFDSESVEKCCEQLALAKLPVKVMIDFSHANSNKEYKNQLKVAENVVEQIKNGDTRIFGAMIESNLVEGRQDLNSEKPLTFGQSITDACIGWDDSSKLLALLADAIRQRRDKIKHSND